MQAIAGFNIRSSSQRGVSVIITSYNRPYTLSLLLQDLSEQLYDYPIEVLVCDDGSDEPDVSQITRSCRQYGAKLLRQGHAGFRAAACRNMGLFTASYPLVLFLDDDLRIAPDFVRLHAEQHKIPYRVLIGPRIDYDLCYLGRSINLIQSICVDARDPREKKYGIRFGHPRQWKHNPWKLFYTCNGSMSRELAVEVGGFDESFAGYGLEDNEFAYRVWRKDAKFIIDGRPVAYQVITSDPSDPYLRASIRQDEPSHTFESYLQNAIRFKAKYPEDPSVSLVLDQTLEPISVWRRTTEGRFKGYRVDLTAGYFVTKNKGQ